MSKVTDQQLQTLYQKVKQLYAEGPELLFHGWHHIEFVYDKAKVFAADLKADSNLTQACALVHDLNYVVATGTWTPPKEGNELRQHMLTEADFAPELIEEIQTIVLTADGDHRIEHQLTLEMKALSDADTLFKALPTVSPIFTGKFLAQNNFSLRKLTRRIVDEQVPLLEQNLYFYSDLAKEKYLPWARENLKIWQNMDEALADEHVVKMLIQAGVKVD